MIKPRPIYFYVLGIELGYIAKSMALKWWAITAGAFLIIVLIELLFAVFKDKEETNE